MHLKILIGALVLGIASASPKAAPKPIPKPIPKPKPKPIANASPQFFQGNPGAQPYYYPSLAGQEFNPQPILGQDAARYYDPQFAPSGYQSTFGTALGAQGVYPQAPVGNYYKPSLVPAGNNYQRPQAPSGSYYQPPQPPVAYYYQPPQAPPGINYQPPQAPAAINYQPPQLIPVPVGYPSGSSAQSAQPVRHPGGSLPHSVQPAGYPAGYSAQTVQPGGYPGGSSAQSVQPVGQPAGYSAPTVRPGGYPGGSLAQSIQPVNPSNYYGAARLWPKSLISPLGSPSPVPEGLARAYFAVSTSSPLDFSTSNNQIPLSTPSPVPVSQQTLIPVPLKVGSRNSFPNDITNYYNSQNTPILGSTQSSYLASYRQQPSLDNYDQRYLQPSGYSLSTSPPQQPTSSQYPVNYQSSPAPFQVNYPHAGTTPPVQAQYQSTALPPQANYQSTPAPPVQPPYQEQSTLSPYTINNYQQTPAPYQGNYQLPGSSSRSPFADYRQQPTGSPYIDQYQKFVSPFGPNYQPTTAYPYDQRIPVPVGYPQSQFVVQPTPPTSLSATQTTSSYPSVPVTSKPISILPTISSTPDDVIVSITENTFIPIPTTPSPAKKTQATIIKSEYSGTVSPQYNHIPLGTSSYKYSTSSPFLAESVGKSSSSLSYAPEKAFPDYSPSTAVSHVSFKSLGNSYSY